MARTLGWIIIMLPLCVGACEKQWVETSVDGLRLLSTRLNSKKNGTGTLKIPVVAGETAFLSTITAPTGYMAHVRSLQTPQREVAFQAFEWTNSPYTKTNAGFVSQVVSLNWPILSQDTPLTPGKYPMELGVVDADQAYSSQPLFVDVLIKLDDDMSQGTLPINIVYTGGLDTDTRLRAAVEEAQAQWVDLYKQIGIRVTFESFAFSQVGALQPPALGSGVAYLDIADATPLRAVNVVIAPSIDAYDDIYGIAGDIPGPLTETTRSAVLISATLSAGLDGAFSEDETRLLAETMAHEVGHFIGLFHPVEASWEAWDALGDTLECAGESECIDTLGENLMFPFPVCGGFSCTPQDELSPDQGSVANRYVGVD